MSKEETYGEERHLRGWLRERVAPGRYVPASIDLRQKRITPAPQLPIGGAPAAVKIKGNTQQVTVTSVSQMVLPADPDRKSIIALNDDTLGDVRMAFGVDATTVTGIRLGANGGGILLDNNCPTSAVYMIGTVAVNSNVTVITT